MAKVTKDHVKSAASRLDAESRSEEVARHTLASQRYPIVKAFLAGDISAKDGAKAIALKPAAFYNLAKRARGSRDYLSIVSNKNGRPAGAVSETEQVEDLIQRMIDKHFAGKAASFAHVWKQCQSEADKIGVKRPGYPTVRRRLLELGPRELDLRRHGAVYVDEKYGPKPGFKETQRPLEWVQIDHTVVDLIVVDEVTRKVIGRPWLSLAVCLHTRVVLGFYLSLLPPSAVTVAMLVENCVLPKDRLLASLNLPADFWPMHGLVETFHTDNAKEFVSDVFALNLKSFEVEIKHRQIGKKHQGGHIESLIGKFMTKKIHFLRGTTYSNTVMRRGEDSEKNAQNSFEDLKFIMVCAIKSYHETKHSALGMAPAQKWEESCAKAAPRQLPIEEHENFRYLMYPEVADKFISDKGIQFKKRFYYSSTIKDLVREKALIKFDPYDMTFLMVKVNGKLVRIPCVRNPLGRSDNWEITRFQIQQKGVRNGTVSQAGTVAMQMAENRETEAIKKTVAARRAEKKEKGKEIHKTYNETVSGTGPYAQPVEHDMKEPRKKKSYNFTAPDLVSATAKKQSGTSNLRFNIRQILEADTGVDFTEDVVIY